MICVLHDLKFYAWNLGGFSFFMGKKEGFDIQVAFPLVLDQVILCR